MTPTLARHFDLKDDDLVPARAHPHEVLAGLGQGRSVARGLHLTVTAEHVRPVDLSTIARPEWLPPGHAERAEHEHRLAKIADAERALSELEGELLRVRRARMTAQLDGAKPEPEPDERKLRHQREDAVVVARAALIKFADGVLGKIRVEAGDRLSTRRG